MAMESYISVLILFGINLLNYMDRFTIAGVLSEIEKYYDLNHSQSGLLQTSFIICYMIFAPLFGYLGDRYNRKLIMICGVCFWSVTTLLGSFIPSNYTVLFFMLRALVGVGEASYSTIAPTIIADLFAPGQRSRMLGVFYFAIPVGSGMGYIVGSSVSEWTGNWKNALRVTPGLGLLCALLIFLLVREPQRGESDGVVNDNTYEKTTIIEDIRYLVTVRSYVWSTIGFTCVCFAVGGLSWWAPMYMKYAYAYNKDPKSDDTIGLIFGVIACIGGIIGVFMGMSGSQYYRLYNPRADPLICATGVLTSVPFCFLGIMLASKSISLSWFTIFLSITLLSTNWSVVADMLLYVITPNRRSFAQSLQILTSHLFGDASSPFIIGLLSDSFNSHTDSNSKFWSLQYSLYLTPFVIVLGGFAFLYTSLFIVTDREICKTQTQGQRSRTSSDTSIHTLPPNSSTISITGVADGGNGDIETNNSLVESDTKYLIDHS